MNKLAVIILDALDTQFLRNQGMANILERYNENGDIFGCSSFPHTAVSNPRIWGGYENHEMFWVDDDDDEWADPANEFDRGAAETKGDFRLWERSDYDTSFVWDIADDAGLNASALQIPITLPPYSFNAEEKLDDAWFPNTQELIQEHTEKKPEIIEQHAKRGDDLICTSIQVPDKWIHGLAEGKVTNSFVKNQAQFLDQRIDEMLDFLESEGYGWMIFGDHGNPDKGTMPMAGAKQVITRHRSESIIFSNLAEFPSYSGEMYEFICDFHDLDPDTDPYESTDAHREGGADEVTQRLEDLGYR